MLMPKILLILGGAVVIGILGGFIIWSLAHHTAVPQAVVQPPWQTYATSTFSVHYPPGYAIDTTYAYAGLGPKKEIPGIQFTIDPGVASGTNLGVDSYISVEELSKTKTCTADMFLPSTVQVSRMEDNSISYSFASTTGAGAGNRWEEWVYTLPGTSPCIAVRYFIHYSVIENYPPGTVQAFDHAALLAQFGAIRRSLTLR